MYSLNSAKRRNAQLHTKVIALLIYFIIVLLRYLLLISRASAGTNSGILNKYGGN